MVSRDVTLLAAKINFTGKQNWKVGGGGGVQGVQFQWYAGVKVCRQADSLPFQGQSHQV